MLHLTEIYLKLEFQTVGSNKILEAAWGPKLDKLKTEWINETVLFLNKNISARTIPEEEYVTRLNMVRIK
jgi:hypothetical protein